MGGNQSKQDQPGIQEHERLGSVIVKEMDDPNGEDKISTMEFMCSVESEKLINDWLHGLKKIDDNETRQTILIPDKHQFKKAGLCGSSGTVNLLYENFPFMLESQISNRNSLQRDFLQTEMWYLLYSMVRAGTKFEKLQQKIGDVHPFNILINDDGQIKLISKYSIPGEKTNFEKAVEDKKAKVFLAPEELHLESIQSGEYPENVDPSRAQVFSIGVTILASGILNNCQAIYMGYDKINEGKLNEFLHAFRQKYSPFMFNILCNMVCLRPNERRSCSSIFNELKPFEDQILDLQPFEPRTSIGSRNSAVRQSNFINQGYNMVQPNRQTQPVQYQPVQYQQTGYRPQSNVQVGHTYLK